jgi:hypothetical protein
MENHTEERKPLVNPEKEAKDKTLASEAEAAAAQDEPMGSIAAAVPGDNAAAEDGIAAGRKPGAEETKIQKEAGPTAGTEFPADKKSAAAGKSAA